MKLSKKAATRIASLINSTHVAQGFIDAAIHDGDFEKARRWVYAHANATVALADEFGIELPALSIARSDLIESRKEWDRTTAPRIAL